MSNPTALKRLCPVHGPTPIYGCAECARIHLDESAALTSKEQLREALADVSLWLRSALDCKQWVWDSDQRLAAMGCLATADELLKSPPETKPEPRSPKVGDEVVLHFQLSEDAGGFRSPQDGWKIAEVRRSTYFFLDHPNGSRISLLPDQFSVKSNEQLSAPAVVRPTLSEPNSLGSAAGADSMSISKGPV